MDNDLRNIFNEARRLSLTAEEKAGVRAYLSALVEAMPVRTVRTGAAPRGQRQGISPFSLFTRRFMPVFGLVLAASLAVGGVSYAAEGSLPGDALYPVKVAVNEEVRAAAAITPKAKAEWEAERAMRRLEEAERLAAKERLDAGVRAKLEQNFAAHAGRVAEKIVELEAKNDAEAAAEVGTRLEGSLAAHKAILSRLSGRVRGDVKEEVETLAESVREEAAAAGEVRGRSEDKVVARADAKVAVAAEARLRAVGKVIADVQRLVVAGSGANAGTLADAKLRLSAAETAYADGRAKLEAGANAEAFALFQKAHKNAVEARSIIRSSGRIEVRVRGEERRDDREEQEQRERDRREDRRQEDDDDDGRDGRRDEAGIRADVDAEVKIDLPKIRFRD
jgi:hypothetical protein